MRRHLPQAAAALVAFLLAGCGSEPEEDWTLPDRPSKAEQLLYQLKVAWNPRLREEAMADIRAATGAHPAIVAVCARPKPYHALLPQAMTAVGELRRQDALPHVQRLMVGGPEQFRRLAVAAVHGIQPLSASDLEGLLDSTDLEVVLGALDVCRLAQVAPETRLGKLLFHADPRVRDAAIAAVPPALPPQLARQILELLQTDAEPQDVETAMRVLGRCEVTDAIEKVVSGFLMSDDLYVRTAAVRCLANKSGKLSDPGPMWELATDPAFSQVESALAFECLERTRSYSVDNVISQIGRLDPARRYRAARCLVLAGRKDGVGHFLDLYEELMASDDKSGLEDQLRVAVLTALQQALFTLSGTRAGHGLPEWRAWYEALAEFRPPALPPAPVVE